VWWRGSLALSPAMATSGRLHRVVIRELELFETDQGLGEAIPIPTANVPVRQKLVYVDYFPLTFDFSITF
jgi:hypothetical protein